MAIREEIITELVGNTRTEEELFGKEGLFKQLKKQLIERILDAELEEHLGYPKHAPTGNSGNSRNGKSRKTVKLPDGQIDVEIPRDRQSNFEPQLIQKGQRRLSCLNDAILSLYGKGMTSRDIESHLRELYGTEISHSLILRVTDAVLEEVASWRNRPLESIYPIVYLDGFVVKCRLEGQVQKRTVYVILGIDMEGRKDVLGLYLGEAESSKFWLKVMDDLKHRGLEDIFILCADGLTGLPEAVEAAFPQTIFQTCVVHMVRNSLKYVPYKEKKAVAKDLKLIYGADTLNLAENALVHAVS